MQKTYIIKIEQHDPETDLDAVMRETVSYMGEQIDPGAGRSVLIDVTDHEGNFVAGYDYEPDED